MSFGKLNVKFQTHGNMKSKPVTSHRLGSLR